MPNRIYDAKAHSQDIERLSMDAMRRAVQAERRIQIERVASGETASGAPQKGNTQPTIRQKGHGLPLVGKSKTLLRESSYPEVKLADGWALAAPEKVTYLRDAGYEVFELGREEMEQDELELRQAMARQRGSYQK